MMKRALFIGRFQPFHNGHLSVLEELAKLDYSEVVIAIGSSQYKNLPDNPFSFAERSAMINKVLLAIGYTVPYSIVAIPDIHDDARWVEHVNNIVHQVVGEYEAMYTGNDWVKNLFEQAQGNVKPVHKIIMIDGTTIRKLIRKGDMSWKQFVHVSVQEQVRQRIEHIQ